MSDTSDEIDNLFSESDNQHQSHENMKFFFNRPDNKGLIRKRKIEDIKFSHSHVAYPCSYLVEDLVCRKIIQHHGLDVLQLLNGRSSWIRKIHRYCKRSFWSNCIS